MNIFKYTLTSAQEPWAPLFEMEDPPHQLHILATDRSHLNLLTYASEKGIGIVGTRHPTQRSIHYLKDQIPRFKPFELITLSGCAQGIDQHCHQLSIEFNIPTIAILGCGLEYDYPKNVRPLKEKILEKGGLIVSEFDAMEPPYPSHFLKRNRLIAAWSKCLWMVEAKLPSGALNTAHWARKFEKTCYVTPSFPGDPSTPGNQKLLDDFQATPYWGVHSLGSTWLELATVDSNKNLNPGLFDFKLEVMMDVIHAHTLHSGSMSIQNLLDTLLKKQWSFNDVFLQFQIAQEKGFLSLHQGMIEIKRN